MGRIEGAGAHAARAKLFMPFDALKGFREALAERERPVVTRGDLADDRAEEIDRVLRGLRPGDMVTLLFDRDGECIRQFGLVARVDGERQVLQVVGTEIRFDEIVGIEVE